MRLSIPPTIRSYIQGSSLWAAPWQEYGRAGVKLVEKLKENPGQRVVTFNSVEVGIMRQVAEDLLYFATEGDGTSSERRAARNLLRQIDTGGRP